MFSFRSRSRDKIRRRRTSNESPTGGSSSVSLNSQHHEQQLSYQASASLATSVDVVESINGSRYAERYQQPSFDLSDSTDVTSSGQADDENANQVKATGEFAVAI